ncbi:hypothetical protein [uncultured Fibrobacter sp.]|uniref:hypothetical protein n=1 Tax=uncultured Fibrobacter sp. TaxID=261512 RepID=UPI0028053FEC|nr:hypothetical protein [uncultured Fibrobacter sp.]
MLTQAKTNPWRFAIHRLSPKWTHGISPCADFCRSGAVAFRHAPTFAGVDPWHFAMRRLLPDGRETVPPCEENAKFHFHAGK